MPKLVTAVLSGVFLLTTPMSTLSYAGKNADLPYTSIGYIGNDKVAYVTVNDEKVITIKSDSNSDGVNPLKETKELAKNLNKLIYNKKLRADKILPGIRNNKFIIKSDKDTIFTVGKNLAEAQKTNESDLTLKLTNTLRVALGANPINYLNYKASRSTESYSPNSQFGYASWYGPGFNGRPTSSGEIFNQNGLTAAHRTLPLGTPILVTNLDTGRSVIVKVNDRGPFADTHKRVIDLSYGAFKKIAPITSGVARIKIDVL